MELIKFFGNRFPAVKVSIGRSAQKDVEALWGKPTKKHTKEARPGRKSKSPKRRGTVKK